MPNPFLGHCRIAMRHSTLLAEATAWIRARHTAKVMADIRRNEAKRREQSRSKLKQRLILETNSYKVSYSITQELENYYYTEQLKSVARQEQDFRIMYNEVFPDTA